MSGPATPSGSGRSGDRALRVLVVEDEATLGRNIKDYLEEDGLVVELCGDGETGVEAFARFRPDVVLLDYRLPGMDGLEVLACLRAQQPAAAVILMTAEGGRAVAAAARQAGAVTCLAKPLVLSRLRQVIDQAA